MPTHDDDRLARYLLAELPEDEQTRLEEEFFNSPEALERLAAAEDDLIDDYVDGSLVGDRRRRFEQRMSVSPARRQRLEFARDLARYAASRSPGEHSQGLRRFVLPPAGQLAMAASLLLALGGTGWLAIELRQARHELARVENERRALAGREQTLTALLEEQRRAAEALNSQPPDTATPPPTGDENRAQRPIVALSLLPGLVRSPGAASRVTLPAAATTLRLELQLPQNAHQSYRVLIETARGRAVWTQERVAARQRGGTAAIVVDVPARVLGEGEHVAVVSGLTTGGAADVASYAFTVLRR
jgi:hypothetical protein